MELSYSEQDWILNGFNDELSYKDHAELKKASKDRTDYLSKLDRVSREQERMRFLSHLISYSNALEGSTLTDKDTFNYLFNDITPKGYNKKELFMADNLLKAWEFLEKNYSRFPKHDDIKTLHILVNRNIETEETLGNYKKVQNYIGDKYTSSFLFVEEKMHKLLKWINQAFKKVDDFEVAFQSHAQFELIHPFVDGNGRVGRLLINWLLMYNGFEPLAIPIKNRSEYISALENAQKGKVEAICRFCFNEYLKQYSFM